jgi:hypothetical protein
MNHSSQGPASGEDVAGVFMQMDGLLGNSSDVAFIGIVSTGPYTEAMLI